MKKSSPFKFSPFFNKMFAFSNFFQEFEKMLLFQNSFTILRKCLCFPVSFHSFKNCFYFKILFAIFKEVSVSTFVWEFQKKIAKLSKCLHFPILLTSLHFFPFSKKCSRMQNFFWNLCSSSFFVFLLIFSCFFFGI